MFGQTRPALLKAPGTEAPQGGEVVEQLAEPGRVHERTYRR